MKFQQTEHFTEKSSTLAGQNFNVSLSAKMFETLFSNMYRYKEAAATRELERNAFDAHVMRDRFYRTMPSYYQSVYAKQKESVSKHLAPFGTRHVVHLPSMCEPYLEVKDFGIGLHIDDIVGKPIHAKIDEILIKGNIVVKDNEVPDNTIIIGEPAYYGDTLVFRNPDNNEIIRSPGLYTTIFNSTKSEDNDQVGAYGLGSKSPFAISDSFTVESRYEGELHRFLMFLDADRIPCVDVVTKDLETRDPKPEQTDQWNGLTVNVPVRESQYSKFASELSKLCSVMEEKDLPIITNDVHMDEPELIDRSHRVFNTYIQKNNDGYQRHYAVMGGVAYPVDQNQLTALNIQMLSRFPATYTYFPLGAMNIPPSREDITYDEFGRNALNAEYDRLREGLMEEAEKEMAEAVLKGPLAAFVTSNKYIKLYGSSFGKIVSEKYPRDKRISSSGDFINPRITCEKDHDLIINKVSYTDLIDDSRVFKLTLFSDMYRRDVERLSVEYKDYIFVILDNPKTYIQKLKTLTNKENKWVVLVTPNAKMISYRNSKLRSQYKNAKEIRDFIRKWVGCKEHLDYLQFADTFSEFYEGLIGTDIRFMSELPYDRPVIINNSTGMVLYKKLSTAGNPGGEVIDYKKIQEIIDSERRIIYVEMKGATVIHKIEVDGIQTDIDGDFVDDFSRSVCTGVRGLASIAEENGFYDGVFLAKKMSIPFLKKHPDTFVPLDVAAKEFYEKYKEVLKGLEFKRFAGMEKPFRFQKNHTFYLIWIVEQLGGTEGGTDKYSLLLNDLLEFQKSATEAADKTSYYETLSDGILSQYKDLQQLSRSKLVRFSKLMSGLFKLYDMGDEYEYMSLLTTTHSDLVEQISDMLGVGHRDLFNNKNKVFGRNPLSKLTSRYCVRRQIEAVLLYEFINSNYKGKMGNKLNGREQFRDEVIKSFFQNNLS